MIDSHCHIDVAEFDVDREDVVARARAAGLAEMLVVGSLDEGVGLERALAVGERFALPVAAGVHPHEARSWDTHVEEKLRGLARERRIVAIGEIGLDFHYDHSPRPAQREAFRRQVHLARDVDLPVVIHTREADEETITVLEEEGASETGGVLHCFTGGLELARRCLGLGLCVSFSGIVAFPRAELIRRVAREIPDDRLLVETDAPYLAPPPHRGQRNEPAFVVEVARHVAALRGVEPEAVGALALRNYARLFRRPLAGAAR